ncbi:MAG: NTP transferase domain-containing protein [Oscillospiraceae bacterium]|jgi:putative nucleotidyltransferase with HDIG domain|nr:NTP transferase domain-containing protein [Oscillospiraceae bacterium]
MTVQAIILAAGLSSRMTEFKPLLPVGGTTAIRRTIDCAATCGTAPIVVTGHRADELTRAIVGVNVTIAHNDEFRTGMFSSVQTGLRALSGDCDAFFLLPADCCAVSPNMLQTLISRYVPSDDAILYPTHAGRRGHPPLIPAKYADGLLKHDGSDGARGYLHPQPSRDIPVDDAGILLDMDTPDDYAKLLRYLGFPTFPADAETLLSALGTAPDIAEHGRHVAATALKIAETCAVDVNRELLRAAALLHDIERARDEHAAVGAATLMRLGYPDCAKLVARHMDAPDYDASNEEKLLYLADKLCRRGEIVPPSVQTARMREKFAGDEDAIAAAERKMSRAVELLCEFGLTESDLSNL